jgi:hypothetical protein
VHLSETGMAEVGNWLVGEVFAETR